MLKNVKKVISGCLALIMTAGVLIGCTSAGSNNQQNTPTTSPTTTEGLPSSAKSSKIVDKPLTLTYWVELDATKQAPILTNLKDPKLYQELEKRTGITIEFIHPPAGQAQDTLNLLIVSGDYPDILEGMKYPGGAQKAYDDGVILRLNDLVEKYAPNLNKILQDNPLYSKRLKNDKGDLLTIPFIRGDAYLDSNVGPILRKDWLDKLGLKVPVTIDDWYNVLKAFREQDPNGNGQKDEIPFIFLKTTFYQMSVFSGAYGVNASTFHVVDDKVKYGPIEPAYKDFLETMHKWYVEGLIDPDFAAIDQKTLNSKVLNNLAGSWIGGAIGAMGTYLDQVGNTIPGFALVGAPWAVLKEGEVNTHRTTGTASESVFISSQCKYVEEAVKWLDYGYSEEGNLLYNFGIEGESYNMVNGYPKYTELITNNPDGKPMPQIMSLYMKSHMMGPFVQRKEYLEQTLARNEQKEAVAQWAKATADSQMFGSRTSEENAIYSPIFKDCETYMDEMRTKFIMGEEPLSKFDQYVAKMKEMGIDKAIEIRQAGHTRYLNR